MRISIAELKRRFSGLAPDEASLVQNANLFCEEALNRMAHKGSQERATFSVSGSTFTLPWYFSGVVGIAINRLPRRIFNQWWEVQPLGQGIVSSLWSEAIDAGDGFVVFKDLSEVDEDGCYLKVISDTTEQATDLTILMRGPDVSGEPIRSQDPDDNWMDGEQVAINNSGEWTTQKFTDLKEVVKPETDGRVRIYASATLGDVSPTLVAIYQPLETNPSWRRYRVQTGSTDNPLTVDALCQVAFRWAEGDNDLLTIGNYGAMRDGLLAMHAKNQQDYTSYERYMSHAIEKLNYEHKRYHGIGGSKAPAVRFGEYPTKAIQ